MPDADTTRADERLAEMRHVRAEMRRLEAQARAAGRDGCRRAANLAQHQLWQLDDHAGDVPTARRLLASSKQQLSTVEKQLKAAKTPEQTAQLQEEVDHARDVVDDDDGNLEMVERRYDFFKSEYRRAINALKECRKKHAAKHECGERGGPGLRRPDGKCYSWTELARVGH